MVRRMARWCDVGTSHKSHTGTFAVVTTDRCLCHADKLLNNIVAVMVITTHSVVISLVPWSKIEQYDVTIGKYFVTKVRSYRYVLLERKYKSLHWILSNKKIIGGILIKRGLSSRSSAFNSIKSSSRKGVPNFHFGIQICNIWNVRWNMLWFNWRVVSDRLIFEMTRECPSVPNC